MRTTLIAAFLLLICYPAVILAEYPEYSVNRTIQKIVIDGKLEMKKTGKRRNHSGISNSPGGKKARKSKPM